MALNVLIRIVHNSYRGICSIFGASECSDSFDVEHEQIDILYTAGQIKARFYVRHTFGPGI